LIVGFDFTPPEDPASVPPDVWVWVEEQILRYLDLFADLGIIVKLNSGLRALDYRIAKKIKERGLLAFFDLKLIDIPQTLTTDGILLRQAQPDLLTVMCNAGEPAMAALKGVLPKTDVLGVTLLTSFDEEMAMEMYKCSVIEAVQMLAKVGKRAGVDGLICSPKEATVLRGMFGDSLSLNTPAVRPLHTVVKRDDQNLARTMTPKKAFEAGADRIVVSRPIFEAKNPHDAILWTLDEIASACA
jgi:orotidine-5'-phosphate decarboxylase